MINDNYTALNLGNMFDSWASQEGEKCKDRQWLLSKWEVVDSVEWPHEKINLMINDISKKLDLSKSDNLIDLGCGGGWITRILSANAKKTCGLDISQHMIDIARNICKDTVFVRAEIEKLPFKESTFSRILTYFVFINIIDVHYIRSSIQEMIRILKEKGKVLIGQLPDERGIDKYNKARSEYLQYCNDTFKAGKDYRNTDRPPIKLFDKKIIASFLDQQNIKYSFLDSFNPFYYSGQPKLVDWRFDVLLEKQ